MAGVPVSQGAAFPLGPRKSVGWYLDSSWWFPQWARGDTGVRRWTRIRQVCLCPCFGYECKVAWNVWFASAWKEKTIILAGWKMLIASWNVNSIKARMEHVVGWLESRRPDVLLLQELKGH